jgi:hypothetical protein
MDEAQFVFFSQYIYIYINRDTQCNETQKKPFARIVDIYGHVMDQLSAFDESEKVLIGELPFYIPFLKPGIQ